MPGPCFRRRSCRRPAALMAVRPQRTERAMVLGSMDSPRSSSASGTTIEASPPGARVKESLRGKAASISTDKAGRRRSGLGIRPQLDQCHRVLSFYAAQPARKCFTHHGLTPFYTGAQCQFMPDFAVGVTARESTRAAQFPQLPTRWRRHELYPRASAG